MIIGTYSSTGGQAKRYVLLEFISKIALVYIKNSGISR